MQYEIDHKPRPPFINFFELNLRSTGDEVFARVVVEFGRTVGVECTPVVLVARFTVSSSARRLPWFVEGLEVENVEVPVKGGADALLPEVVGFGGTGSRCSIVGST